LRRPWLSPSRILMRLAFASPFFLSCPTSSSRSHSIASRADASCTNGARTLHRRIYPTAPEQVVLAASSSDPRWIRQLGLGLGLGLEERRGRGHLDLLCLDGLELGTMDRVKLALRTERHRRHGRRCAHRRSAAERLVLHVQHRLQCSLESQPVAQGAWM
jgi:hypothetical protein